MYYWPQDVFHVVGMVLAVFCGVFVWFAAGILGVDRPKTVAVAAAVAFFLAVVLLVMAFVPPPVGTVVWIV